MFSVTKNLWSSLSVTVKMFKSFCIIFPKPQPINTASFVQLQLLNWSWLGWLADSKVLEYNYFFAMSGHGFCFINHLIEYERTWCNVSIADIIAFSMILVVIWSISSRYTVKDALKDFLVFLIIKTYRIWMTVMLLQSLHWLRECLWKISNEVIMIDWYDTSL